MSNTKYEGNIVNLNVGGRRFSTSKQTLTWIPDSFFTGLLDGKIPMQLDETGAVFIDRDPDLFAVILNCLRTRNFHLGTTKISALRQEAEFYCLQPLVYELALCERLEKPVCGGVLFHCFIPPPDAVNLQADESSSVYSSTSAHSCWDQNGQLNSSVRLIRGHHSWLAVAFTRSVACYRLKTSSGWCLLWQSERLTQPVRAVCLSALPGEESERRGALVAGATGSQVHLWFVPPSDDACNSVGTFELNQLVDELCFVGRHLVALSHRGKIGVWHAPSKAWQTQDVQPISSYASAGTFLVLGLENGSISYIDMQKFPLRMKDNDLLITELFRDPNSEAITALSVFNPLKASTVTHKWVEIAYGTREGNVRVVVQHAENAGASPQLFQTFCVHRAPVILVSLAEKTLVSACAEYNHVRSWSVTRFRGMISTQPGPTPLASFKVLSLDTVDPQPLQKHGTHIGPYGEPDEQQVFVQRVVPNSDSLIVRQVADGHRSCEIHSVDESIITSFMVHECEGSNRTGSWPRRYIFTGHANGAIQVWDLTTGLSLEQSKTSTESSERVSWGPSAEELLSLMSAAELSCGPAAVPCLSTQLASSQAWSSCNSLTRRRVRHVDSMSREEGTQSSHQPTNYSSTSNDSSTTLVTQI